jgi:hypothetical protein
MASNHTKASAITERIAAEFFWENGYNKKYKGKMSKDTFLGMTEDGELSISNVLENFIIYTNPKKKKSNENGMDFTDKSDAKYMSTRIKQTKNGKSKRLNCRLSPTSLKNKTGTLRVAITVYNPEDPSISKVILIRIPYPDWTQFTHSDGGLNFEFSLDGSFKAMSYLRFSNYVCTTIQEFCK